jgi:hypothetical protein
MLVGLETLTSRVETYGLATKFNILWKCTNFERRSSLNLDFQMRHPFVFSVINNMCIFLAFVRPCIVIYFYSKTNQMHNISSLFYFGTTLYMFRTVSPSIIRILRLYIQHQVYVIQVLWLLANGNEMEFHLVSSRKQPQNLYDIYLMLYVQSSTPDDGRKERPKHVDRLKFKSPCIIISFK